MSEALEKEFTELYNESDSGWANFLDEAEVDTQMVCGAQFTPDQEMRARFHQRSLLTFNRMARQVHLLSGYEIRNRHSLKIGPVEESDDIAASQHTALISNQMWQAEGYEYLSDAFKWGTLVSGSNLLELWRDRSGNPNFHRRGYSQFLLDPMLSRPDLSDCSYVLTGQWLRESRIQELVPDRSGSLKGIDHTGHPRWPRIPGRPDGNNRIDPTRLYEEYWKREMRYESRVVDRMTGQDISLSEFANFFRGDKRRARWAVNNIRLPNGAPAMSLYKVPDPKITLSLFADGKLIWTGDNPLGFAEYPFIWIHGDWLPEMDRDDLKLQSFVRILRDPQHARNKRLNQMCDILEAQITMLRLMRQGSLVDAKQAYKSGPTVVEVAEKFQGGLLDAFQQLPGPGLPAGVFQLLEVLDREDIQAGGLNEEIFGSDDKDIPGILHRFRTGQALTGQQGMFTSFRRAKRLLGKLMVRFNQSSVSPQKVARTLNQQPHPDFYKLDFARFDCTPTEGLLTADQQQLWYAEIKELAAMYPNLIPGSEVVRAAPVAYPERLRQIVEKSEQNQQQVQQRQMQQEAMMNQLMAAKTQGEIASSMEDQSDAVLNRAKTATEMAKLGEEAHMDWIDRQLRLMEIQIEAEKVRIAARQTKEKTK